MPVVSLSAVLSVHLDSPTLSSPQLKQDQTNGLEYPCLGLIIALIFFSMCSFDKTTGWCDVRGEGGGEWGVNSGVAMEADVSCEEAESVCVCVLFQTWSDHLTTEDVGVRGERERERDNSLLFVA